MAVADAVMLGVFDGSSTLRSEEGKSELEKVGLRRRVGRRQP